MGLTTAMYTGLTGLNVNQSRIETIGHNIANVNTTAFRGSRTLFQTQFYRILSMGTPPGNDSGGTNPMQIGHGAVVGTTQRTTTGGSLETTGLPSDLALDGAGYFVVHSAEGRRYFTRDGAFALDASNQLVDPNGYLVQGYGVDANFNVIPGTTGNIVIPLGQETIARATQNVIFDGDLSSATTPATTGAALASQALISGGGAPADVGTALTDLRSAANPGVVLFADGDVISVSGATKGGRALPPRQFIVGTTGNSLGDFASWLQQQLGIDTTAGLAGNPGVVVENGALVVRSNAGEELAIDIGNNDIMSNNPGAPLPFQFTQTAPAIGPGVFASFTVYDSLGAPIPVNATFVLESTPNTGPVWRYYLESGEQNAPVRALGTGTVAFDPEGNFVNATGNQFTLDRSGTGAVTPLTFSIDFATVNGLSTQTSNVIMADQDGYPPGTLTNYAIGVDGTITGIFSNGLARTLGQVAVATFTNEAGLVAHADNLYTVGANSGNPLIGIAGQSGAGQIRSHTLELSNVDLAQEFIGLITSSTAFQAASRVISTSNEMLDQLLMTLR